MSSAIIVGGKAKDKQRAYQIIDKFVQDKDISLLGMGLNRKLVTSIEFQVLVYANQNQIRYFDAAASSSRFYIPFISKSLSYKLIEKSKKINDEKFLLVIHDGDIKPYKSIISLAKKNNFIIEIKEI